MLQKQAKTKASLIKSVGTDSVAERSVFALQHVGVALGTTQTHIHLASSVAIHTF